MPSEHGGTGCVSFANIVISMEPFPEGHQMKKLQVKIVDERR